jgi:hypothetical protein
MRPVMIIFIRPQEKKGSRIQGFEGSRGGKIKDFS